MVSKNKTFLLFLLASLTRCDSADVKPAAAAREKDATAREHPPISIKDFRFAVAVSFDNSTCTGLLVDALWVMALYDCFDENPPGPGRLIGLSLGPSDEDRKRKRIELSHKVSWIYDHPLVMAGDDSYGFVLLELEERIPVGDRSVSAPGDFLIPLSSYDEPVDVRTEALAGRGANCHAVSYENQPAGEVAVTVFDVTLVPAHRCRSLYAFVPQLHLCAELRASGEKNAGSDRCTDMVGALLICENKVHGFQKRRNRTCGMAASEPVLFMKVDHTEAFRKTVYNRCVGIKDCYWNRHFTNSLSG